MFLEVVLLLVAFIAIWLSTGYVVESIKKLSSHSRFSSFSLSLFVIGVITSLPEVTVTVNSILLKSPQIALGNLIGTQIFLLFLVIPVLAIVSNGLHLHTEMKNRSVILTLLVALAPILALLNQSLELLEAVIVLVLYALFAIIFSRHSTFLERITARIQQTQKISVGWEFAKILCFLSILFLASNTAVREMIELAAFLQTPRFLLSLLILPIGTNLPELSLALGSLAAGKKDLALADFMGALTFNSLLIAVLALGSGGTILIGQNISMVVIAFIVGIILFWWCCYSKKLLSIREGLLLLLVYLGILGIAVWQIMSGILR